MSDAIPDDAIPVLDHGFVRLDGVMADDLSVANAARVSFARRKTELDESDEGLIRFLMRDRHGCYDDATEVLTDRGSATWDERTNMIVVRDINRGVSQAVELVRQFDTQTPQILIESNIVEAQKTFLRDLGLDQPGSLNAQE